MTTSIDLRELAGTPLVVCVSTDPDVRERLAREVGGIVLMCPDLGALRSLLAEGDGVAAPTSELSVDPHDHQVTWRGSMLPLTRLECDLIARLSTTPVRVWTYERLFAAVWGGAYLGDNSILHSAMKRLRRKLRDVADGLEIETVRGIGYRLTLAPARPAAGHHGSTPYDSESARHT